ncbi:MAG: glycogen synthase GlgA [Gammaproteobacteria bacterium]|nr:glycogen synthase GlgA [Gammaproteobacteria bacterium]
MHRILFATSEVFPLIKTGGLADVSGSLPPALQALHYDVHIIIPGYQDVLTAIKQKKQIAEVAIPEHNATISLWETRLPGSHIKVWLVDFPPYFDRPGNPYHDTKGEAWPDNADRFALFARTVTAIALDQCDLSWKPDLVHCNDWQTGLVPALLSLVPQRPATVFSIHNLAYQGLFPRDTFDRLQLPEQWWSPEALEFYGQISFIKGGLCFADQLTTVSPGYANEIQTPEFGHGLEGLLRHRSTSLTGILNGIDDQVWNPGTDRYLPNPYNWKRLEDKQLNKTALQEHCGLTVDPSIPVIGLIGRLVHQKGIDMVLHVLPELMLEPVQFVILGSGELEFSKQLQYLAQSYPQKLFAFIGYDEALAHLIEGGADMFLMPSRFEPCGLNQLYSLRYGTLPIVRAVGGLADTITDAEDETIKSGIANGIVFRDAGPMSLLQAVKRALDLYRKPKIWKKVIITGMRQSYSWETSAKQYGALYDKLLRSEKSSNDVLLYHSG